MNNFDFFFSFFLALAVCPPSLFVVFSTHAFPLHVLVSSSVSLFFTVKLFNSFIGVSTLVTFERHGCVRGVVYMSNVSCNISLLFYCSFELILQSPAGDRSLSSSFSSASHPRSLLPSFGFYRRRPGGIVKARHEERYAVSKQVLWDPNIAYELYEIVALPPS